MYRFQVARVGSIKTNLAALFAFSAIAVPIAASADVDRITVERANGKPLAGFDTDRALGASIDGGAKGEAAAMFRSANLAAMRH